MARVPSVSREILPTHLQESFDQDVLRRGQPNAINAILLYSPEAATLAHHWIDYIRKDPGILPKHLLELAMLVVARERDCQYIWNSHAELGRKAGLSADLVNGLRDRSSRLPAMSPEEAAVIAYGQEYFRTGKVSKEAFENAHNCFGTRGLVELTMLMGYYATLAFTAAAFEVQAPSGQAEPLLPI